jgi:mannose-6-phosphate isomerase-like protein (cupin superfamily)
VAPFDFKELQIRELTPADLHSASVAEVEVHPGSRHETARSTKCDKIYICIEGTMSFHVKDEYVKLECRDVLFVRKNEWFNYHNDSGNMARLIIVHIPPFDLESEEFQEKETEEP